MNFNEFFYKTLFSIGENNIQIGQVLVYLVLLLLLYWGRRLVKKHFLPKYFKEDQINTVQQKSITRNISLIFILFALLVAVLYFRIDYLLFQNTSFSFLRISYVLGAALIIQIARLFDWLISKVMLRNYYLNRDSERIKEEKNKEKILPVVEERRATRTIQYIVYILSTLFIIRMFRLGNTSFDLSTQDHSINLSLSNVLTAILVLLVAQLIIWVSTQIILYRYYKRSKIDVGSQYAINQLLKYIIYIVSILVALDQIGIQMNVLLGGAAALLVGIGLGLQQTFNDLISGVILLFERTVEVEDVVDINGLVGKVKKIGLRTSLVETFDNITVIVPNSKLIVDNVVNWSHYDDKARFSITIGIAYGSDTTFVKKLLLDVARENVYVLDYPTPLVRFVDFGDSALVFELHFWTHNFIVIEDIKSDLRFSIDHVFREKDITIPFPQRVVWNGDSSGVD